MSERPRHDAAREQLEALAATHVEPGSAFVDDLRHRLVHPAPEPVADPAPRWRWAGVAVAAAGVLIIAAAVSMFLRDDDAATDAVLVSAEGATIVLPDGSTSPAVGGETLPPSANVRTGAGGTATIRIGDDELTVGPDQDVRVSDGRVAPGPTVTTTTVARERAPAPLRLNAARVERGAALSWRGDPGDGFAHWVLLRSDRDDPQWPNRTGTTVVMRTSDIELHEWFDPRPPAAGVRYLVVALDEAGKVIARSRVVLLPPADQRPPKDPGTPTSTTTVPERPTRDR